MKPDKSDIPADVEERLVQNYRSKRTANTYLVQYRVAECVQNGIVVGLRSYAPDGMLVKETPLKNGLKHGREFTWNENGHLELIEPYFEGKIHGTARQYDDHDRVIGTYKMVHGTGYDIWRSTRDGGRAWITEIFTMRDGLLHGYEWWVNADQRSVSLERHWREGEYHGIERMWNASGQLKRGYPKYWINGRGITRREYLRAASTDATLPVFQAKDNMSRRRFPAEIEILMRDRD